MNFAVESEEDARKERVTEGNQRKKMGEFLNPYKKIDKNEDDTRETTKKRQKMNKEIRVNEIKGKEKIESEQEPMRWSDYPSSGDESASDKEMAEPSDTSDEENRRDSKKREINEESEIQNNTEPDTKNNPWMSDTRNNQVRFAEKAQRGYWAKIKFEAIGYHKEQDKNGNKKLYNFELDTVQDVLTAILRKGKLIDPSFAILPRGENDNRRIDREQSIPIMVKELNKSLWLEGERKRYKRIDGGINEIRKTIKEGFNMDMGIRFITNTLNDMNIKEFIRDWHYVARNEPNTYLFTKESEDMKKIRVHELILRPVQEENVEEIAYILGSTSRNQDGMEQLMYKMEQFVEEKLKIKVKMGYQWTTPDLGYMELTRFWSRARREQDPRIRRATEPSIMVLYMGMKQYTKKIRMETIKTLLDEWGNFQKIDNGRGGQTAQYQRLPGGNRGVLIPPIETLNKEDSEALIKLYERHISNKEHHNLWIQTNITDMDYEILDEQGDMITIREYILNQELVPGMMTFSGVIKYQDMWKEYPKKYYLVTNNVTGEAATKKLEQITKEIIQKNPNAMDAFQEMTVGPLTAFSQERNEPSRTQAYKFNLSGLLEDEKTRLRDIVIDGKKVMDQEIEGSKTPWTINEMNSNRTYTTEQITKSIVGMEISIVNDMEPLEQRNNSRNESIQISQSPATNINNTTKVDEDGFTKVVYKRKQASKPITIRGMTNTMEGSVLNLNTGQTINYLSSPQAREKKDAGTDSLRSIGESSSHWSSSTGSQQESESEYTKDNMEEKDNDRKEREEITETHEEIERDNDQKTDESTSDLEEIQPINLKQLKELKEKIQTTLNRRNPIKNRGTRGGRGGRGSDAPIHRTQMILRGEKSPANR